jgi:hypothetical protein
VKHLLFDLALALLLGAAVYAAVVYLLSDIDPPRQEAQ